MGYDVRKCVDYEQLFSAVSYSLAVGMLITGDTEITEENWLDVAARITIINRLLEPQNSICVSRHTKDVNGKDTYESIVLDWRTVKRYIGMTVDPVPVATGFMTRMHKAVRLEIQRQNAAEEAAQKQSANE